MFSAAIVLSLVCAQELFTLKNKAPKAAARPARAPVDTLFSQDRAQQIEIVLRSLKMQLPDLKVAIVQFDTEKLPEELLEKLHKIIPAGDEVLVRECACCKERGGTIHALEQKIVRRRPPPPPDPTPPPGSKPQPTSLPLFQFT